jgi:hypothetical protein
MPCNTKEKRAAYMRLWRAYPGSAEKVSAINKACRLRNLELRRAKDRVYYQANKTKILASNRAYKKANPVQMRGYKAKQRAQNPLVNLKDQLRRRVLGALARVKAEKAGRTFELIGCTPQFLKEYLESKFQAGMSWALRRSFHIDHIKPCAAFDLTNPEQQKACFHYTNLQPLWPVDNIRKGASYG